MEIIITNQNISRHQNIFSNVQKTIFNEKDSRIPLGLGHGSVLLLAAPASDTAATPKTRH